MSKSKCPVRPYDPSVTSFKAAMAAAAPTVASGEKDKHDPGLRRSMDRESRFLAKLELKKAAESNKRKQRMIEKLAAEQEQLDETTKARVRDLMDGVPKGGRSPAKNLSELWCRVPLHDFESLVAVDNHLPDWYAQRLKWINAQINWRTSSGEPAYFNKVASKGIPVAERMAVLASIQFDLENDFNEGDWIDRILTCGLLLRQKARRRFVRNCQELDFCPKCAYANTNNGIGKLTSGYNHRAFTVGGNWYTITIAPRLREKKGVRAGRAVGGVFSSADFDPANPNSVSVSVGAEVKPFVYASDYSQGDPLDEFDVERKARIFLGAGQNALRLLRKNHRCDGVRARSEVAVEFVPFRTHWHWHAVASSTAERDPQKIAEFIKTEVDEQLAKARIGLTCEVRVKQIQNQPDLERWIAYMHKPIDLVSPVESFYDRFEDPSLDEIGILITELGLLRQRLKRTFKMKRHPDKDERGKHTYHLRRSYVVGSHRFGRGTILYESPKDRERRQRGKDRKQKKKNQAKGIGCDAAPELDPG